MDNETKLECLTKEIDSLRKIIETQQNTLGMLIDYFILEKRDGIGHKGGGASSG